MWSLIFEHTNMKAEEEAMKEKDLSWYVGQGGKGKEGRERGESQYVRIFHKETCYLVS